jgi:hypothetical protein
MKKVLDIADWRLALVLVTGTVEAVTSALDKIRENQKPACRAATTQILSHFKYPR